MGEEGKVHSKIRHNTDSLTGEKQDLNFLYSKISLLF